MSSAWWAAPPASPTYSDAPYGRSPSGRAYKFPPTGWVPPPAGGPLYPTPRRKRSLGWLWWLGGCGAALLVVAVVVALTVAGRINDAARVRDQAAATTLTMPPRAGGLVRSTNPKVVALTNDLQARMQKNAMPGVSPQAAGYAASRTGLAEAVVMGVAQPIPNPERELHGSFKRFGTPDKPVAGVASYPSGPLGGFLRCGEVPVGSLCGWADHGALVMVLVPAKKPDQAAPLVLRMRADIEHRRS